MRRTVLLILLLATSFATTAAQQRSKRDQEWRERIHMQLARDLAKAESSTQERIRDEERTDRTLRVADGIALVASVLGLGVFVQRRRRPAWGGPLGATVQVLGIVGFLCLPVLAGIWYERRDKSSTEIDAERRARDRGDKSSARVACEEFASRRLVAPLTASFSVAGSTEQVVEDLGDGHFRMGGIVDSKNLYGVPLRNFYACDVQSTGDHYTLLLMTVH